LESFAEFVFLPWCASRSRVGITGTNVHDQSIAMEIGLPYRFALKASIRVPIALP